MSIYLDYAATTPFDKEILEKVLSNIDDFGNPSSTHKFGKKAKSILQDARAEIAHNIGAKPDEIIFTSGATEANNLAIKGTLKHYDKPHFITTNVEHSSVKNTYEQIEQSYEVTYLNVDHNGLIDLKELKSSLKENTVLVSIIYVNNETGIIQPVKEIAEIVKNHGALLHLDGVQSFGHVDIDVNEINVDYLSLSAHKIYGPKGIGVLYHKENSPLNPMIIGGSHERSRRAGTENGLWAVAMANAMTKVKSNMIKHNEYEKQLKQLLIDELNKSEVPFEVNGDLSNSSSHIINFFFPWAKVEVLLTALDMNGVMISGGSACNSGTVKPSHVITSMYDENRANHSFRFSFCHLTQKEEIVEAVKVIGKLYKTMGK